MYDQVRSVLQNRWIQALGAFVALGLAAMLFYLVSPLLIPVFLALLVAYLLDPVVDLFERRGVRRSISTTLLAFLSLLVLLSIPVFLVPRILVQAEELITMASTAFKPSESVDGTPAAEDNPLDRVLRTLPVKKFLVASGWATEGEELTEERARAIAAENIGLFVRNNLRDLARSYVGEAKEGASTFAGFLSTVWHAILRFLVFLANFSVFAFAAGYLLVSFDILIEKSKELVPIKYRDTTFSIMHRIDVQLRSFVRGQFTVALCLALIYTIGLTAVARVPFGFLIAIFTGFASFIPYLGVLIGFATSVIMVLIKHGLDWHLAAVIGTFIVAQSLEETTFKPLIVGGKVGLHPVWVMAAILVFGHTFGFLGVLLAVPIAAVLKVLVLEAYARYRHSKLYSAEDDLGVVVPEPVPIHSSSPPKEAPPPEPGGG